ncbi:MAG: hypothetical protein ACE5F6_08570 [Anaerolineae bacterium]
MTRSSRLAAAMLFLVTGSLVAIAGAFASSAVLDLRGEVDLRILGRNSLDHLGRSAVVGDFNHDGRADVAVGAGDSDPTGNVSGEVYVLFGAPVVSGQIDMAHRSPDVNILGGTNEGRLGHNLAVADLNGDGIDDLIVLDYNAGPPDRPTAGASHVFFGGTETWNRPIIDMTQASGDVIIWGAVDGEHAGAVYVVDDLNSDGIDDLILGAPASNRSEERIYNSGAVYVLYGRRDLSGTVDLLVDADLTIRGVEEAGFFGSSVGLGDLDGDGSIDLVVGLKGLDRGQAIDAGALYVFFELNERHGVIDLADHAPDLVLWGVGRERVGSALAVGDANGDGRSDLLIGAPTASPDGRYRAGMAYLVLGPLDAGQPQVDVAAITDVAIWGPAANAPAGDAVALWDLGGDGLAEVLVNAPEADVGGRTKAGLLAVWNGRVLFEDPVLDLAGDEPDWVVWGDDPYTRGAWFLSGTGDVDGNGRPDLLLGIAETEPEGRNEAGTVYGLFNPLPVQSTPTPSQSPSPSPTPTETATLTPSPSVTPTATSTPSPSATSTASRSPTATTTPQPSPTASATGTPTRTQTPTPTSTATATATPAPAPLMYLALVTR